MQYDAYFHINCRQINFLGIRHHFLCCCKWKHCNFHKYYKNYCVCSLTSHSRACSTAGGPCSNRSRSAHLNTPRTWRRSRATSARSRAAGSGRRWEPRSLRTAPRLLGTPDLRGTGPVVGTDRQQVGSGLGGPQVDRAGRRISC